MDMNEYSTLWRNEDFSWIELLSARYLRFEFKKHWHEELAIGVITDGVEGIHFNGEKHLLPKQSIIAINPAEIHTGFPASECGWQYRMFYLETKALQTYMRQFDLAVEPCISQPIISNSRLYSNLLQLHLAFEQHSLDITKESLLIHSLIGLFSQYGVTQAPSRLVTKERKQARKLLDYMLNNWSQNITLQDLAHLCSLDKYQVIRVFKQNFNITPHQFLLQKKTIMAKCYLSQGKDIATVAFNCGFYDQSHLTRNFKLAFGVTPRQYQSQTLSIQVQL
ncbi:AraC family transcriptional regulator [Vibrio sp. SCSIO 43136]|uniref:AraC family transcriptional regulator n=1 Tax=Vibrio sp. SCSIO 43136 TaxID=2819101 RepID=UPI0020757355|nr:AraC family transcriptional regulator [Vibrio sp. SCSIO 43136]USD66109.1 AraC family transcriptional regulator [Vibrio sp. SCSIO 43136]